LPPGLCERLLALPVRRDVRTGTVDVAVVDARDPHPVEEVAHWLAAPVRMVRTSLASMDAALRRVHGEPEPERALRTPVPPIGMGSPSERLQEATLTSAFGLDDFDERRLGNPLGDWGDTEFLDFPVADPNIPFALTRKSVDPVELLRRFDPGPDPAVPETEPVLDLRRRKSAAPSAQAPPLAAVATTLEAIREAHDRDSILELVVAGTRTVARKVAVLAVRRDALVGWTCSPELGERNAIRAARVSPGMSDVFTGALATDTARLARIPKDAAHAPLLSAMRAAPSAEVALVAVRVEGKAVALVLADELGDPPFATRRMEELARAAGEALGRLLRERRKE